METLANPSVTLFGIEFDLTILAMSLMTVFVVFGLVAWSTRKLTIKPKGKQNVIEYLYDFVRETISPKLGKYTDNYSLFFFVLFLFLIVANNLGLLVKLETEHFNLWTSPTSVFAVDLTLAGIIAVICHVEGIRKNGLKGYLAGFTQPHPAMLPMNILEEVTSILSLSLRLFGNIFVGEVMTSLILQMPSASIVLAPFAFILNMLWAGFSIFISCIQAYVFIILSSTYLGNKINSEEE
ncbi:MULTISPECIES: F0F1 ATP synthase subunit A [unclassified Streptococcus]|uniref:F0F1 ATP synthase subunit A n=1 Tax=unclassified Streptococcus TaxID=2608887 RepID=UPI0011B6127A|nr:MULTISPECIES: F0F1 ATP synthase subunit A [unclassified Streptococcus]TWS95523.1 F0F1 ATP synthase subunit A [Streptococcus sp. sy018]TWT16648.1 F0F1 ATP synthase subunit A [Streptococcus sp. sy010]